MLCKKPPENCAGFTLVELVIALAISGIVAMATYSAYRLQVKTSAAQDTVSDMQQNLRGALSLLTNDLRLAGYDPDETGDFAFVNNETFSNGGSPELTETVSTNGTQIAFTMDIDGDGTLDKAIEDANGDTSVDMIDVEQVSYRLNGMQLERYTTTVSGAATSVAADEWQQIAENIEAVEFYYTLNDGTQTLTPTGAELFQVRSVQVSILARSEQRDTAYVNTTEYIPASSAAPIDDGSAWDLSGTAGDATSAANDNFRRRLLITTIQCRNMGI